MHSTAMPTPTPSTPDPSRASRVPLVAIAAALGLAVSAGHERFGLGTVLIDAVLAALQVALVWGAVHVTRGERGAIGAALALVLFVPLLGAIGGGGLPAPLLLATGLIMLGRCLLDPTVQRIVAAGACLGLAVAVLEVDGAGRGAVSAWLAAGSAALLLWRALTAERCEPRRRVVHGAAVSVLAAALVAAAVLAAVDALPPFETAEYTAVEPLRIWPTAAATAVPGGPAPGWLVVLNALPLLGLAAARGWRPVSRYADGAAVVGLVVALGIGAGMPEFLALLAAPWLAVLAGASLADGQRPAVLRLAALALVVQALTAVLLWPDYPRLIDGWAPVPVRAEGIPA